MKSIGLSFASMMVLGLTLAGATASQAAVATAAKNVSRWVVSAQKVGAAEDSKKITLSVFLSFKNRDDLKSLVAAQSTPGSVLYGKYLTPDQFRARFAPDAGQVKLVEDTLRGLGFTILNTPKSGLFVQVSGTVAQIKTAFGVSQKLYAFQGKVLRANAESPKLPAKIAGIVTYISGLDDTGLLRKPMHIRPDDAAEASLSAARSAVRSARSAGPTAPPPVQAGLPGNFCSNYFGDHKATLSITPGLYPQTVPWELCGYRPAQLRQAYGADKVTQDGTGVRVAIVDAFASSTIVDDTNRYANHYGLPKLTYLNFQQILPPGIYNAPADDPCEPQGWYEEESLDVQAVHSMAPGAYILYSGATSCQDSDIGAAVYNIIDNHMADIITNSYGDTGDYFLSDSDVAAADQYYLQAAAEGITLLYSSGDNGDIAAEIGAASGSWQSTDSYVTSVGGTSLALLDSTGAKSEWGWGNYRSFLTSPTVSADGKTIATSGVGYPFSFYAGSGGGPSLVILAPDYQSGIPYSLTGFTHLADKSLVPLGAAYRVTPDIAMDADPYTGFLYGETFTISGNPVSDSPCKPLNATLEYCEGVIGGTSLASPLFAGVMALVDQARFAGGKTTVGFINPALYSMKVGKPMTTTSPIVDVQRPATPTAVLRGYLGNPNRVRLVTMNSVPNSIGSTVSEGIDTSYKTLGGYDLATGLGTPYVPALISAFGAF